MHYWILECTFWLFARILHADDAIKMCTSFHVVSDGRTKKGLWETTSQIATACIFQLITIKAFTQEVQFEIFTEIIILQDEFLKFQNLLNVKGGDVTFLQTDTSMLQEISVHLLDEQGQSQHT